MKLRIEGIDLMPEDEELDYEDILEDDEEEHEEIEEPLITDKNLCQKDLEPEQIVELIDKGREIEQSRENIDEGALFTVRKNLKCLGRKLGKYM